MPYVTLPIKPKYHQISLDEIMTQEIDLSRMITYSTTDTRTYFTRQLREELIKNYDYNRMIQILDSFCVRYQDLFRCDRNSLYNKFYIPKKSGGLREINAPLPELMEALRQLKAIFEKDIFALYHTTAFAYIKGRNTIDSIKRHQMNKSNWFVKLDFEDFFGSTTENFIMEMFSVIFPFCEIIKLPRGRDVLSKALSLCFLNGGLPQGTPISPLLTNLMMIPIDHQISNSLRKQDEKFVYTRYADDILISSKKDFDYKQIEKYVVDILKNFEAPFSIKKEKTRYGSSAGRNWNLGVMLNKDNQITIGHNRKKAFKAMCCNYINDKKNDKTWDLHDVQVFQGLISYYRMVEKDYIDYVIKHNNEKFSCNIEAMIKADLA